MSSSVFDWPNVEKVRFTAVLVPHAVPHRFLSNAVCGFLIPFSFHRAKKDRTKRWLAHREPKIIEDEKRAMFVKGHKTSQVLNDALNDMVLLINKIKSVLMA